MQYIIHIYACLELHSADRLVEEVGAVEHIALIGNVLGIPAIDVTIVINQFLTFVEHIRHIGYTRQIGYVGSRYIEISTLIECTIKRSPFGCTPLLYEEYFVFIGRITIKIDTLKSFAVSVEAISLPRSKPCYILSVAGGGRYRYHRSYGSTRSIDRLVFESIFGSRSIGCREADIIARGLPYRLEPTIGRLTVGCKGTAGDSPATVCSKVVDSRLPRLIVVFAGAVDETAQIDVGNIVGGCLCLPVVERT